MRGVANGRRIPLPMPTRLLCYQPRSSLRIARPECGLWPWNRSHSASRWQSTETHWRSRGADGQETDQARGAHSKSARGSRPLAGWTPGCPSRVGIPYVKVHQLRVRRIGPWRHEVPFLAIRAPERFGVLHRIAKRCTALWTCQLLPKSIERSAAVVLPLAIDSKERSAGPACEQRHFEERVGQHVVHPDWRPVARHILRPTSYRPLFHQNATPRTADDPFRMTTLTEPPSLTDWNESVSAPRGRAPSMYEL